MQRERIISMVGKFTSFEAKERSSNVNNTMLAPRHCYLEGLGVLRDTRNREATKTVTLRGKLFYVESVYLKHFYFGNSNYVDARKQPLLMRKSLRLRVDVFSDSVMFPSPPTPDTIVNINVMCYVFITESIAAAKTYDAAHNLTGDNSTHAQLNFVMKCIRTIVDNDDTRTDQRHKNMKALIVAHVFAFYDSLYKIDFATLMLLPLKRIFHKLRLLASRGCIEGLIEDDYQFDENGFDVGSELSMLYRRQQQTVSKEDATETLDDRKDVTLEMKYNEAHKLWRKQTITGIIDDIDEEDNDEYVQLMSGQADNDDEGRDASRSRDDNMEVAMQRYASRKRAHDDARSALKMLFPPDAAHASRSSSSSAVTVTVDRTDTVPAFVAVSTDFLETMIAPLNMGVLTDADWTRLVIVEYLKTMHTDGRHFGMYACDMLEMMHAFASSADCPVKKMTVDVFEACIVSLMDIKTVAIYDNVTNSLLTAQQLAEIYGADSHFIHDTDKRLIIGIRAYLMREVNIAAFVKDFMVRTKEKHMATIESRMSIGIDLAPANGNIVFGADQKRAIVYADLLPFVCITGPGGTGKSEILCQILRNLVKRDDTSNFYLGSFKNVTVNQMRAKVAKICPELAKLFGVRLFFKTVDSVAAGGITRTDPTTKAVSTVEIQCVILDEAPMLSSKHFSEMFNMIGKSVEKFVLLGDGQQLEPINAGCPCVSFIESMSAVTVHLTTNYRSRIEKFNAYLTQLRDNTFADGGGLFDDIGAGVDSGCNFMVDTMTYGLRKDTPVFLEYGTALCEILEKNKSLKYDDVMAVTPYRQVAAFVSWCINTHFFRDPAKGGGMTMEEAANFCLGLTPTKKPPAKYVGEVVSVAHTDPKNKQIAMGYIGKITHIIDHPSAMPVNPEHITDGFPKYGYIHRTSTDEDIVSGRGNSLTRTVILNSELIIPFRNGTGLHRLLQSARCCTVHQSQGLESPVVICVMPPGRLSHSKILYTAASRAQLKCITLTSAGAFKEFVETPPPVSISTLKNSLLACASLQTVLVEFKERAERLTARMMEVELLCKDTGLDDDDDDDIIADYMAVNKL